MQRAEIFQPICKDLHGWCLEAFGYNFFDACPDFEHYYDVHFSLAASQPSMDNDNCVNNQQLLCTLVKASQLHALILHFYCCGFFVQLP